MHVICISDRIIIEENVATTKSNILNLRVQLLMMSSGLPHIAKINVIKTCIFQWKHDEKRTFWLGSIKQIAILQQPERHERPVEPTGEMCSRVPAEVTIHGVPWHGTAQQTVQSQQIP